MISGFIGTHQPAIWMGDYGYVTLMPETGEIQPTVEYRRQPFTHKDETSTPYYYSVKMGRDPAHRILAEITATDHCGYLRFTFPAGVKGSVLVEATRAGTPDLSRPTKRSGKSLGTISIAWTAI